MYKLNKASENLIKSFESLHDGDLSVVGLQPKLDPVGIWTEGYGRAMTDPITKGHLQGAHNKKRAYALASIKTEAEAIKALEKDAYFKGYLPAAGILGPSMDKLNDNQKGALVSFVYNCGTGSPRYKIFANIKAWQNGKMSKEALIKYWESSVIRGTINKKKVILQGLVRRRKAEAELFFKP